MVLIGRSAMRELWRQGAPERARQDDYAKNYIEAQRQLGLSNALLGDVTSAYAGGEGGWMPGGSFPGLDQAGAAGGLPQSALTAPGGPLSGTTATGLNAQNWNTPQGMQAAMGMVGAMAGGAAAPAGAAGAAGTAPAAPSGLIGRPVPAGLGVAAAPSSLGGLMGRGTPSGPTSADTAPGSRTGLPPLPASSMRSPVQQSGQPMPRPQVLPVQQQAMPQQAVQQPVQRQQPLQPMAPQQTAAGRVQQGIGTLHRLFTGAQPQGVQQQQQQQQPQLQQRQQQLPRAGTPEARGILLRRLAESGRVDIGMRYGGEQPSSLAIQPRDVEAPEPTMEVSESDARAMMKRTDPNFWQFQPTGNVSGKTLPDGSPEPMYRVRFGLKPGGGGGTVQRLMTLQELVDSRNAMQQFDPTVQFNIGKPAGTNADGEQLYDGFTIKRESPTAAMRNAAGPGAEASASSLMDGMHIELNNAYAALASTSLKSMTPSDWVIYQTQFVNPALARTAQYLQMIAKKEVLAPLTPEQQVRFQELKNRHSKLYALSREKPARALPGRSEKKPQAGGDTSGGPAVTPAADAAGGRLDPQKVLKIALDRRGEGTPVEQLRTELQAYVDAGRLAQRDMDDIIAQIP